MKGQIQESVDLYEKKIEALKACKQTLENNKSTELQGINALINDIKNKLRSEYATLIGKIDDCYKKVSKSIEVVSKEKETVLEQAINETQVKLQSLLDAISINKHKSSQSTATERAKLLKDDSVSKITIK